MSTTTINPRSSWQTAAQPVTGSGAVPNEWLWNTLHWPGGTINVSDPAAQLRGMQSSYLASRGYSLGYNFAVYPDGSQWEIRGFDIRCAANGSQEVNRPGVAILLAVPNVNTPPTDAMTAGVRNIIALTRSRVSQTLTINSHSDVRPGGTACAGDVIRQMIAAGTFEPQQPEPAPTPPPEEDNMQWSRLTITEAGAIFMGWSDGRVFPQAEWVDGNDPEQLARYEAYGGDRMPSLEVAVADLSGVCLLGPVPTTDDRLAQAGLHWSAAMFGNHIG